MQGTEKPVRMMVHFSRFSNSVYFSCFLSHLPDSKTLFSCGCVHTCLVNLINCQKADLKETDYSAFRDLDAYNQPVILDCNFHSDDI